MGVYDAVAVTDDAGIVKVHGFVLPLQFDSEGEVDQLLNEYPVPAVAVN